MSPVKRGARQKRSIRQRSDTKATALFSSFTINRDPDCSKYLPYNELVYPNIFNDTAKAPHDGSAAAAQMKAMWLVGNAEHTNRRERSILLRDVRDFVSLPGSGVLPGSDKTLATLSMLSATASTTKRSRSNGASVSTGSLSAHSTASEAESSATLDPKSALTPEEHTRLRELERRLKRRGLLHPRLAKSGSSGDRILQRAPGLRAYLEDNRKMRRVLQGGRPPSPRTTMRSLEVETLLRLQNRQRLAAVRIQRWWRVYYMRARVLRMHATVRGLIKLQAVARGFVARRYMAEWYERRSVAVIKFQTLIRRGLSNRRLARQRQREHGAATKIQALERGKQGRAKARRRRGDLAALRIQRLWRGCVVRARVDRAWLGAQVTRIQCLARRFAAAKKVCERRVTHNAAARAIQSHFRGFTARQVRGRCIWEAEQRRRRDFLMQLAAEEDWARENAALMQRRLDRAGLKEAAALALKEEERARAEALGHERACHELSVQRQTLSPRALEQGWREELDLNLAEQKHKAAKARAACMFGAALRARSAEEELAKRQAAIDERREAAERFGRWREKVRLGLAERESRRRFDDEYREQKRRVADERRRWAISSFTATGKPDKRGQRATARAALASKPGGGPAAAAAAAAIAIERAAHEVFTGGSVDLFANQRSLDEAAWVQGGSEVGSRQRLKHTMARLQLQTHMAQVTQFEAAIRPATNLLAKGPMGAIVLQPEGPDEEPPAAEGEGSSEIADVPLATAAPALLPPPPSPQPTTTTPVPVEPAAVAAGSAMVVRKRAPVVKAAILTPQNALLAAKPQAKPGESVPAARRSRRTQQPPLWRDGAKVQWQLLDELEGVKHKAESTKALWHLFRR